MFYREYTAGVFLTLIVLKLAVVWTATRIDYTELGGKKKIKETQEERKSHQIRRNPPC